MSEIRGTGDHQLESQPNNEKNKLKDHIEKVTQAYHFDELKVDYYLAPDEANKTFLTMLHDYVSKSGYSLRKGSPDDMVQILDFGSGVMPYMNGYMAFFQHSGLPENQTRKLFVDKTQSKEKPYGTLSFEDARKFQSENEIKFSTWDADRMIMAPNICSFDDGPLETDEQIKEKFRDYKVLDVLTMFGCGPGQNIEPPKWTEASYGKSIALLAPYVRDNGLLIMTTSFGGPSKESLLQHLQKNGFEILLQETNKYSEEIGMRLGFTHEDIIIARKITGLTEEKTKENIAQAEQKMAASRFARFL